MMRGEGRVGDVALNRKKLVIFGARYRDFAIRSAIGELEIVNVKFDESVWRSGDFDKILSE